MDKEDVEHVYNELLHSQKREWNNTICNNMDGPRGDHTKWGRERQIPYDLTYVWNLKIYTNKLIYRT